VPAIHALILILRHRSFVHAILLPGTSLALVYGTLLTQDPSDATPTIAITTCTLDGHNASGGSRSQPSNSSVIQYNQLYCSVNQQNYQGILSPGEHELIFQVNYLTNAHFLFDYIVYEPLPGASVDGETLQIGNGQAIYPQGSQLQDSHFSLSSGWRFTDSDTTFTATPGSSVTVKFNGL
jgi:hypothetical protein